MNAKNDDPLAVALKAATSTATSRDGKVEQLFGDRPAVLEGIIVARRDNKLSFPEIARLLSREGKTVSSDAVRKWLTKKGIK